jgi:hypothetical protein
MNAEDIIRAEMECSSVECDGDCITIHVNDGYDYNIGISRIDTAEKLISWIMHLTEKPWFSREMCRAIIRLSAAKAGIDVRMLA